jgi:hypothetical protein
MKDKLDLTKIQGQWINYFDEKELKNKFLCMGAKLLIFDEQKPQELSFQQSNSIYDELREHLREEGDPDADQKYFINSGRKAVFGYENDKSIAIMKPMYVQQQNELEEAEDKSKFSEAKFEHQYVKYFQILDTDYETYMVTYQC